MFWSRLKQHIYADYKFNFRVKMEEGRLSALLSKMTENEIPIS